MFVLENNEEPNTNNSSSEILEELKKSYKNFHKTKTTTSKRLPTSLYVNGLDDEQIWQQIELINNDFLPTFQISTNSSLFTAKPSQSIEVKEDDVSSVEEIIKKSKINQVLSEDDENESNLNFSENNLSDEENSQENDSNDDQADFEEFEKEAEVGLSSEDEEILYDSHIGDEITSVESENEEILTSFQKQQKKMAEKIEDLEEKALQPKKWQMTGEVSANSRPMDSLVDENLNFEYSTVPAPPMTLESNKSLEGIIIERIKNKTFDDVERKVKPVDKPIDYKKESMIDQEKSKKSLAEIYQESRANSSNISKIEADKKLLALHSEIRSSLNSLFSKLNSLCSFHYSPASTQPDAVIVNNMAALYSEEKIPTAESTQTGILAPEEITNKRKSGAILGKEERTDTDRKRERRKKKNLQHYRQIKNSNKVKNNKSEKSAVEKGNEKALRSSTALFETLENNKIVESVKRKNSVSKKFKTKKESLSKKLKL